MFDFGDPVGHDVVRFATVALLFMGAEVDPAGEFADKKDVHVLEEIRPERGMVGQRREDLNRTELTRFRIKTVDSLGET